MKIERIDDKTVKCFLSNEELEQYDIDYKDFLTRSDKAREVVQEIIQQATEEVGYKPPHFAFDLQIMMLPDQGMLLTFSERDPSDVRDGSHLMEYLKEMRKILQQAQREAGIPAGEVSKTEASAAETHPEKVVFLFDDLRTIMELARAIPRNLRIKSVLYAMDGKYYLYMQKGKASYERYSKACIQAMEFGMIYSAAEESILYLQEHAECVIRKHALRKLHD